MLCSKKVDARGALPKKECFKQSPNNGKFIYSPLFNNTVKNTRQIWIMKMKKLLNNLFKANNSNMYPIASLEAKEFHMHICIWWNLAFNSRFFFQIKDLFSSIYLRKLIDLKSVRLFFFFQCCFTESKLKLDLSS